MFVKVPYRGKEAGADTFAHDVLRGRDAGLHPLIRYYLLCFGIKIKCWSDLKRYFEKEHLELMQKMYKNVEDIDLMIGILLEKQCGNLMGKIGGCLVAKQFYRFKYGDRHHYSHPNGAYPFTKSENFLQKKKKTIHLQFQLFIHNFCFNKCFRFFNRSTEANTKNDILKAGRHDD